MKRIAFIIVSLVFSGIVMGQEPQSSTNMQTTQESQYQTGNTEKQSLVERIHEMDIEKVCPKAKWFFGAGFGMSYYIGDHNRQAKVGDMLDPALNIYGGRWITKVLGMRLGYAGYKSKALRRNWGTPAVESDKVGLTGGTVHTDSPYGSGQEYKMKTGEYGELQKFKYMNLHFDLMFNVTHLLYTEEEYNKHRLDIAPYVGIGWAQVRENVREDSWSANFGIYSSYRIVKGISAVLDLHAGAVEDTFDGVPGERKGEAIISGTLGINYRF